MKATIGILVFIILLMGIGMAITVLAISGPSNECQLTGKGKGETMGELDAGKRIVIDGESYVVDDVKEKIKTTLLLSNRTTRRTTVKREVTLVGYVVREQEIEGEPDGNADG